MNFSSKKGKEKRNTFRENFRQDQPYCTESLLEDLVCRILCFRMQRGNSFSEVDSYGAACFGFEALLPVAAMYTHVATWNAAFCVNTSFSHWPELSRIL
jgi:hypothetical protein